MLINVFLGEIRTTKWLTGILSYCEQVNHYPLHLRGCVVAWLRGCWLRVRDESGRLVLDPQDVSAMILQPNGGTVQAIWATVARQRSKRPPANIPV